LILLNLPPHLRYLPENIYLVGVIPGHPSTHRINNFLDPLVDEFLEFWVGVFFTRTELYNMGRHVRTALALVICDMLAARQTTGLSSQTSTMFCTTCALPVQNLDNIDRASWPPRSWDQMKRDALAWKNAESDGQRRRLFKETYMRWSSLNRLPYWNAVKQTVPDQMHFGLLGMFQEQCRVIWGINVKFEGGDGSAVDLGITRPSDEKLNKAINLINDLTLDAGDSAIVSHLKGYGTAILKTICFDNGLNFGGKAAALAETIFEWVRISILHVNSY
ncbi:hypothetical protein BDZ89DRAFT_968762, partial [Hymenopellis radicata]